MFSIGRKVNSSISGEQLEGRWPGLGALLSSHKASMTSPLVKPQGQPLGTTALTGSRGGGFLSTLVKLRHVTLGSDPCFLAKCPCKILFPPGFVSRYLSWYLLSCPSQEGAGGLVAFERVVSLPTSEGLASKAHRTGGTGSWA